MSEEEQRIAIAEFLNWTQIREQDYDHGHSGDDIRQYWVGIPPGEEFATMIPEFNLNEMHEVLKYFDDKLIDMKSLYYDHLSLCVEMSEAEWKDPFHSVYAVIRATAAHQREAFLKTLGLWKE